MNLLVLARGDGIRVLYSMYLQVSDDGKVAAIEVRVVAGSSLILIRRTTLMRMGAVINIQGARVKWTNARVELDQAVEEGGRLASFGATEERVKANSQKTAKDNIPNPATVAVKQAKIEA